MSLILQLQIVDIYNKERPRRLHMATDSLVESRAVRDEEEFHLVAGVWWIVWWVGSLCTWLDAAALDVSLAALVVGSALPQLAQCGVTSVAGRATPRCAHGAQAAAQGLLAARFAQRHLPNGKPWAHIGSNDRFKLCIAWSV